MKYVEKIGDLVEGASSYDVILQGCNCQNIMGSGIAYYLRKKYPQIYEADTIAFKANKVKLGTYSEWYNENIDTTFVNCYTQFDTKGRLEGRIDADYNAIKNSLALVNSNFKGKKIGLPLIGCGLAGGNWKKVKNIIQTQLVDVEVTVVFILKDYIKMKIVEFFEKEYNISLYSNWNDISLVIGFDDYTYFLDLYKLSNSVKMSHEDFTPKLNSNLLELNCIKESIIEKNKFLKLIIADDYERHYK